MSVNHIIEEIEAGLAAARALKAKNDAEQQRLLEEKAAADQKLVDDLAAAAALVRATQQQHEDESKDRDHDLAQANRVAGDSTSTAPKIDDPFVPIPAPAVSAPTSANPPTAVAPPVPAPAPAPQPVVVVQPRSFLSRPQTGLQWVLAIVGIIVGAVIARVTYDPMWSQVTNDLVFTVLVVLWFIVLIVACFFTGGMLGALYEEHKNRNNRNNQNNPPAAV